MKEICCEQVMVQLPSNKNVAVCLICLNKNLLVKQDEHECCFEGSIVDGYCINCNICYLKKRRHTYKPRYHLGEILSRLECREKNKPTDSEVEDIKLKIGNDFSKEHIYKHLTYQQRKHFTFIYCSIKGLPFPKLLESEKDFICRCFTMLRVSIFQDKKRNICNYCLIIDAIAQKLNKNCISEYIYYKKTKHTEQMFKSMLDEI